MPTPGREIQLVRSKSFDLWDRMNGYQDGKVGLAPSVHVTDFFTGTHYSGNLLGINILVCW